MKRPTARYKPLALACLWLALMIVGSTAPAFPQNRPQIPGYTVAEFKAFKAANDEKNAQAKLQLLDDFTTKYPESVLIPYVYTLYYQTYFSLENYPRAVDYVDKLLALASEADINLRLPHLVNRAIAYAEDCDDIAFQTPEASTKAKDAASQGLELLNQLQQPLDVSDEEFAALKTWQATIFNSAEGIAESRLKGDPVVCVQPPPPPHKPSEPGQFDRLMEDLLTEQRQNPVR